MCPVGDTLPCVVVDNSVSSGGYVTVCGFG